MTVRRVSKGAVLLALLSGCSPHRPAVQQTKPVSTPVEEKAAAVPAANPVQPPAPRPFRALALASLKQRVPVLTYHDVIGSRSQKDAVWFDCTAAEFEAQMRFLHDQGAHVITLERLRRHLTTGEPLPDRAIALTFDDNYQGVYDHAAPLLKRYGYPYAVFVHTDYVGSRKGRPKMTWAELRELQDTGLVTVGAHTRSHTADLGLLPTARQDDELRGSKQVLEDHLGRPVTFLSYPNGKANASAFERARLAGYTLGFMEEWGPVEQSPGILALNRYIHIQLPRAWAETYGPDALPEGRVVALSAPTPVTTQRTLAAGVRLTVRRGGSLAAQLADGRGLDPTAFLRPARTPRTLPVLLASPTTAGTVIGPHLVQGGSFVPEADPARLELLHGRPLVLWNQGRLAVLPFIPAEMNSAPPLQAFMPGLQGAFVAAAWLVQGGKAMSDAVILAAATSDLKTRRPRVVLGITRAGVPLLGVTSAPVTPGLLAQAAVAAGAQEAVMVF